MRSFVLTLALAGLASACFSPVGEAQCATDADCTGGLSCIDFRCRAGDGGAAGGASGTGGGAAVGGGTAGGDVDAGQGGGSTAGGAAGGGSAVDAGTCGCRTGGGQCQPGDSPVQCGANGAQCTRCNFGEQCVNGACVMAACGPGTCNGCCAPRNSCLTTAFQSSFTCGLGGSMCTRCPNGQDCVNGTCQQAQPCGPMTCASGCCGFGRCVPPNQQQDFACGTGGGMCQQCPRGNSCIGGTCQGGTTLDAGTPGTCSAANCPTGCCAFGRCIMQQTNFTCGVGGAACQQCMGGESCQLGACLPNLQPDGGVAPVLPAGSACTSMSVCDGFCIEAVQFGQQTGFPGGYCTGNCGPAQACPSGACITETVFGMAASTCRSTCPGPGTGQSTCRQGYLCTLAPNSSALLGYCRPNCNNGVLASCPMGQQCQSNGQCL